MCASALCMESLCGLFSAKGGASDYQTTIDIVKFVQDECNKLEFSGLMTIGGA